MALDPVARAAQLVESGRLAELLGSLSLATDLAAGLPAETAIRTSVIAVRLAAAAGVQGFELTDVFYAGLLRFLGCTAYAHEMAGRFGAGDDLGLLRALTVADPDRPMQVLRQAWRGINPGAGLRARASAFLHLAGDAGAGAALAGAHCELAVLLARRLGMSEGVLGALGESYERWDGRGAPGKLRGDAIRHPARVLHVAWRLAAHHSLEGPVAAVSMVAERSGRELDPTLAALALREVPALLRGFDRSSRPSLWHDFLEAEPAPRLHVGQGRLGDVARAFAHFSDVKSPFTTGHSPAVAATAEAAARAAGLGEAAQAELSIAGLLHDLGRVAVPNGIWDKPGPLDVMERERMATHCLETERILLRSPLLAPHAALAAAAHERLDGGGYHRRLPGAAVSRAQRLLAAADVFVALGEDRPHRPAFSPEKAVDLLAAEVRAGRLAAEAVDAVLAGAGQRRRRQAVLSEREAEIVVLVARGLGDKQIAARLFISPSTVKRHLENVFTKIGLHTRAAVAVWAVENDVLVQGLAAP